MDSKKLLQRGGVHSSLVRLRRTMRNGVSSRRRSLIMSTRSTSSSSSYMSMRGGGGGSTMGRVMNVRGGSRSIRIKVRRLQRLVPGGKGLKPDRLFLQTAQYILHLRLQVNVLQTLSNLYKQQP